MKDIRNFLITEQFIDGEVRNSKLRKLLDKSGYEDIHLIKGHGYFYVYCSDEDSDHEKWLNNVDSTSIYINAFSGQSPEQWYNDIIDILSQGRGEYECR